MTTKEFTTAVGQLTARVLKQIYGRGPKRVSVHIARNVLVVHVLDFQPAIDAFVHPDELFAHQIHTAVLETIMDAVASRLSNRAFPLQLKDWCFDTSSGLGNRLVVMMFDQEIRPESIGFDEWERFSNELLRALASPVLGLASVGEQAS